MQLMRGAVRGVPVLHRAAVRTIRLRDRITGRSPMAGFTTLSPDVLPALVRCFELHRSAEAASPGSDLLDQAGYYDSASTRGSASGSPSSSPASTPVRRSATTASTRSPGYPSRA